MRLSINLTFSRRVIVILVAVIVLISGIVGYYLWHSHQDPLPKEIIQKVSYRILYPATVADINSSSYSYQSDQQTLTFTVQWKGKPIYFTEQPAPENLGSDTQAYYPSLGIHPYAQFKTKLGLVALVHFYQSGNLEPFGQSAFLASNGTLLIAHSENDLTNADWKSLFESLKLTR